MENHARDTQAGLVRLFEYCSHAAACRGNSVDLEDRFWNLVDSLNARPLTVRVEHPYRPHKIDAVITANRFLSIMQNALYSAAQLASLPVIIESLDHRNGDSLLPLIEDWLAFQLDPKYGDAVAAAHYCYEESPFVDYDLALRRTATLHPVLGANAAATIGYNQRLCRHWPIKAGPSVEGLAVRTDIPTLLLHGALDPVLPVDDIKQQLPYFSAADYEIFDNIAHGVVGVHPCGETMASEFFRSKLDFRQNLICLGD